MEIIIAAVVFVIGIVLSIATGKKLSQALTVEMVDYHCCEKEHRYKTLSKEEGLYVCRHCGMQGPGKLG